MRGRLLHPVIALSVALLVLNDHVLKQAYPSWWTGKLSDFAGLIFFPVFLGALVPARFISNERRLLLMTSVLTALVFSAVKTWSPATDFYGVSLGILQWPVRAARHLASTGILPSVAPARLVADSSDLFALPAAFFSYALNVGAKTATRARRLETCAMAVRN